ncbi:ABC transporter permease [Actinomyces sp. MRS3W]|uniref:ABC transporter permease n=1 Tax=Actinomyces sp. MRS3W TaxID=2800796 RepID=UPI0028FDA096|nr:ABC transporter permease [Actinomyces sp. MRS3W]MDU0349079.1 ABC transporter permease [Actinomyces sp. MRS3W]
MLSPSTASAPARAVALLAVEALKLRRSLVWWIVVALPLLAVVSGSVNFAMNQGLLDATWDSLTSQVTVFYGLFFFSIGVCLLLAAAWRPEHRGMSWNAMLTTPHSPAAVAAAKTAVVLFPVAVMQLVLVVLTWLVGALVLHLDGGVPVGFALTALLAVVAAVPLVGLQSALSLRLRSFAAPVALGLAGTVISIGALSRAQALAGLWPYALVTRALTLGATTVSSSGSLDWAGIGPIVGWAACSSVLYWGLLVLAARRPDAAAR